MFDKLKEIEAIRKEKERLSELEEYLGRPPLNDFSLLPLLYSWFNEINERKDFPGRPDSVMQRNKFLLIILYFYSPLTLVGGKMTVGLRKELSDLLKLHTPSSISNACNSLLFYYQNYRIFRFEVNKIVVELIERLELTNGAPTSTLEKPDMTEFRGLQSRHKDKLTASYLLNPEIS